MKGVKKGMGVEMQKRGSVPQQREGPRFEVQGLKFKEFKVQLSELTGQDLSVK